MRQKMIMMLALATVLSLPSAALEAADDPFGAARWIGSNPALTPDIDFSTARWVRGSPVAVRFRAEAHLPYELVFTAAKAYRVFLNGKPLYKWEGHVYRPATLRHVNLTPFVRTGENVLTFDGGETVLAVVRSGTSVVAASAADGRGTVAAAVPPFAGDIDFREERESPAFVKRFSVRRGVRRATLHVTGLGFYEARLDGRKIGDRVLDPSPTDYDRRVLYADYELGALDAGEHDLGILLGHGWYDMRSISTWNFHSAPWRDRPKAIARLELAYDDGTVETVDTDGTWDQVESPVLYDCLREGEIVDARRTFGRPLGLKAAEVPAPRGSLEPMRHPAARVVETLAPQAVRSLGGGRWLVTFPRTISGWVRATFRGLAAGDVVALRYDENLGPDGGAALSSRDNLSQARKAGHRAVDVYFQQSGSGRLLPSGSSFQTDHFISAGGAVETFEPRFVYHGFRHVLVEGVKAAMDAKDVVACRVMTDFAATGSFACSDAVLTELVEMTRNSYQANFADGLPTDCPHREKLAWTGDGWIASEFGLGFFDAASSYRKWMRDIFDGMLPSGEACCIAPTSGWGFKWGNGPTFDAALAMIAWNLWTFRGDRAAIEEAYPALVRYLAYEKTRETESGLVANGLGDWNALVREHMPTGEYVISCVYLMLEETAAKMAAELGHGQDREAYEAAALQTRTALRRKYAKGNGVFDNGGQTAQALAVAFGLASSSSEERAVADRLVDSVEKTGCRIDFGLVGSKFVYRALTDIGRADLAYRMIVNPAEPSMTKWAGGNGTLWEDFGQGFSKCHIMLGDFAAWAQQTVAGLRRPAEPGYAVAVVEPVVLPGLTWAKGRVMTPRGELASVWKVADGDFRMDVTVPPGTRAEVRLPDGARQTVGAGSHAFRIRLDDAGRVRESEDSSSWRSALFEKEDRALPFSFSYGGRRFSEGGWVRKRTANGLSFVDPSGVIEANVEIRDYPGFPAFSWLVSFRNVSSKRSEVISAVRTVDICVPAVSKGAPHAIHHAAGAMQSLNDYQQFTTLLSDEWWRQHRLHVQTEGGRSCQAAWPYFNLETPDAKSGLIVAIGWAGQWEADFEAKAGGRLFMSAGMSDSNFRLEPGESVRGPRTVVLLYRRGDWLDGQNLWRRWFLRHNAPRQNGDLVTSQTMCSLCGEDFGSDRMSAATMMRRIDDYAAHGFAFDYWWIDAAWYEWKSQWNDPKTKVPHWRWTGDWTPDPIRFPKGPGEVFAHAKAKCGARGGILWFEIENAVTSSRVFVEHPDWFYPLPAYRGHFLNLANKDAWNWAFKTLDGRLRTEGASFLRVDFNFPPLSIWRDNDRRMGAERAGISEMKHVEAFYRLYAALLKADSERRIDNCAQGGCRNDVETLSYAVPLWRTDTSSPVDEQQMQTAGISLWVPLYGGGVPGTADSYNLRSRLMPYLHLGIESGDADDWARLMSNLELWRKFATPYYDKDFYPLTRSDAGADLWCAWEFVDAEKGEGFVQAFRRADAASPSFLVRPRGLDAAKSYVFEDVDTHETWMIRGDDEFEIRAEKPRTAKILTFHPAASGDKAVVKKTVK